jgi:hypothetical protein
MTMMTAERLVVVALRLLTVTTAAALSGGRLRKGKQS